MRRCFTCSARRVAVGAVPAAGRSSNGISIPASLLFIEFKDMCLLASLSTPSAIPAFACPSDVDTDFWGHVPQAY
jgi:hypothetical protein